MDGDIVRLNNNTKLRIEIVNGSVIGTIANTATGEGIVIDREGLTALMQSFGLLLRKCEEAARQRAHEPVVVEVSDDDDDDDTTPRLPGLRHLRRVLNYSSSSSSDESEDDDDDDEGIFTYQGDSGSENSIPYEEENAQEWSCDCETESEMDALDMESEFFQNGDQPANMAENSIPNYEEENAQEWSCDCETESEMDELDMESDFFQNGDQPANMAENEIIEISDIEWGSDFPENEIIEISDIDWGSDFPEDESDSQDDSS
ncbi:uncharacterized protein LOC132748631 [Ruditapes philippinarum]|uniref:uncharacterized protein LOC132748631 n=1 Tax=Ruditapes philippinarum TaxID=129788 RepID=UPI00295B8C4E|nr:uncharacterized protein LOC132748631 [Ruditapes philippinarum]